MHTALLVLESLCAIVGVCLPLFFVINYLEKLSSKFSHHFLLSVSLWTDRKLAQIKAVERERWARQGRASSDSEKQPDGEL